MKSPFIYEDADDPHDCEEESWDLAWHTNDEGKTVAVHWCGVCGKKMHEKIYES